MTTAEDVTAQRAPRWIRIIDAGTLLLFAAGLWVLVSGGLRIFAAGLQISVTSAPRLVLIALVLAVVRHAVRRRPSVVASIGHVRLVPLSDPWSATLPVWAVSRASVILAGYFAVLVIGFATPPAFTFSRNALLNLPNRWDAGWYVDIAANGYRWRRDPSRQQNIAFFPALPLTMRAAGALLGAYAPNVTPPAERLRLLIAGWLVAIAAFWWALVYVYRWSEARAGPSAARSCVILLAAYPFAVFFSAVYTEALFLVGTAGAFVHFERREWGRSACWGFLVGLVRPNGVLLAIPLALIGWSGRRESTSGRSVLARSLAVAAPALALGIHLLFLRNLTGTWFAWSAVQQAWGRTYDVPTWLSDGLAGIVQQGAAQYVEAVPITVLNASAAALALGLLWPVARTAGLAYALFMLVNLAPALASGGFLSVGRFTSTLFPMFFAAALLIREDRVMGWVLGLGVMQGLLAALYFTGRPLF
jgi:hypothetical protein